ncbi:hypothetical protein BU25DRAFT_241648 [Macroventuria anomochaeta]|uniref:Uncharacterized protein n=1 Tax=Macroventuria anomochaeta TaxID=301207 RepID=A0ACB6RHG0_9PLEO|nr:uncharacterized protein BU25DRAFT_241648 [Macroventuria anomochaeta]KAF2621199.1 hypothetical protein BU25DRAFT_241648 [Macroventuria anomochaeta]
MLWRPLELILESWLTVIRKDKIIALPEQHYATQAESPPTQYPWIEDPYSETILDETIDAFTCLVQAIEDRIPNEPTTADKELTVGLVDEDVLRAMHLPHGFAYTFLLRARRPRFQSIAPGLSVPTSSAFATQPFWSHLDDLGPHERFPPILLFLSSHIYTTRKPLTNPQPIGRSATLSAYTASIFSALKTSCHIYSHAPTLYAAFRGISNYYNRAVEIAKHDPECPFGPPFSKTHSYASGLYLSALRNTEDEITLLLPLHVRSDGFARRSDGERVKMESGVYGMGFTPFRGWAEPTLLDVLTHWLGMVENEAWNVNEQGVVGGIEMWKEGDEEGTWEKHTLPMAEY